MPEADLKRDYLGAALAEVDALLLSTLGFDRGSECAHLFAIHLEREVDEGNLSKEILSRFMSNGLAPNDVGLTILDHHVTVLKELSRLRVGDDQLRSFINDFETVIDHRMKTDPGKVLPRNGCFAEAADRVGLNKWFKPM